MGLQYKSVLWNPYKKNFDLWAGGMILLFVIVFIGSQILFRPEITIETIIIRTTAISAFVLLHFILVIGPLARINEKFLPLLYNRRHLGVMMFLLAATHSIFCIIQFHALGDTNPILSVFTSNIKYKSISEFPFQTLGFGAMIILTLMAITSHDFWLKNLGPKTWKRLHMGVYCAYFLLVGHVVMGILQYENKPVYWIILLVGILIVVNLHIYSAILGRRNKRLATLEEENYLYACTIDEISDDCAKIFMAGENEVAIFKYENKLSAIDNVCKHQMGPLGEGRVINGCVTCPWHGYQYFPTNGQSPPPFKEKVKTYKLRIEGKKVYVDPNGEVEGTLINPIEL